MESIISQNADTDSLLNPNHNLRQSDKKETHADVATIDPTMTHDLAPAKVYPDTELVNVTTKPFLLKSKRSHLVIED